MCIIAIASTLKVKLQPLSRPFATRRVHLCNHLLTLRWSRKLGISRNVSPILLHSRRLASSRISKFLLNLARLGKFFVILPCHRNSHLLANPRKFSHILTNPRKFSQTPPKFPLLLSFPAVPHKFSRNLPTNSSPVFANPRPFSQNLANSRRICPATHAFPQPPANISLDPAEPRKFSQGSPPAYHTFSRHLSPFLASPSP